MTESDITTHTEEMNADLVVVGGGLGGVSAVLAACRLGLNVILVEELDWLGGQLTAQAVPPDEHPWIENVITSRSYDLLRHRIRSYYHEYMPLTKVARMQVKLNPGQGNVSTLCHEPWIANKVIYSLLAPFSASNNLVILRQHKVLKADVRNDHVCALITENMLTGSPLVLHAKRFIDATETGDLLPLAEVEHIFGAESREQTQEPHALDSTDPFDQQAITWCFAADYLPDEDHTIERPAAYDRLKVLQLDCWPGPQFSWVLSDFVTHQPRERPLFVGQTEVKGLYDLWHARRIAYRQHFMPGCYASDITLANWPQMDYWEKPVVGVTQEEKEQALEEARQLSLSFFYWMQTEAPRHNGGYGYRGLRLRGDVLGTSDGLAKQAYYREGRRIKAEFTVLEQHIGVQARSGFSAAEKFYDSVGVGAYRIDLHPSTTGRNTVDIDSYPFQIPLGALIPVRIENLIPACKNIGTTRITNGAFREHTTEWSIGEAAGALAAFTIKRQIPAKAVRESSVLLADFQAVLQDLGVLLEWPVFGALTPVRRTGYQVQM